MSGCLADYQRDDWWRSRLLLRLFWQGII